LINLIIEDKYNLILIIINKFIKYLYVIVYKEKFIAKQLKYIILNRFIQYHNIFKRLINNKDKLFTFNY